MTELKEPQLSKTHPDSTGNITLYHVTRTRYLTSIFKDGLIPGVNYAKRFYGIGQDMIDLYVPPELAKSGVSRRGVVYCHLDQTDAESLPDKKSSVLAVKADPSRIFISDLGMAPLTQAWNYCLSLPFSTASKILTNYGWTPERIKILEEKFERNFLDNDFEDQIFLDTDLSEDAFLKDQLLGIIQECRKNIATKGRREARAYWKNVVSYNEFISDFRYSSRIRGWISERPKRRIYLPEALIPGKVDPQNIKFLSRGIKKIAKNKSTTS